MKDIGFLSDNYERSYYKVLESLPSPNLLFEFDLNIPTTATGEDFKTNVGGRILLRNIGFDFLNIDLDLTGFLANDIGLSPVFPVNEALYKPSILNYGIAVSTTIAGFLQLGFEEIDFTEEYKMVFPDPAGYLQTDLSSMRYQKYSLKIINFQALARLIPGYNSLEEKVEELLYRMGFKILLLAKDYLDIKMLNGVFFTGIPILPIIAPLYIKDRNEYYIATTIALPLFGAPVTIEPSFMFEDPWLYRLSVSYDLLGALIPILFTENASEFNS